MSACRRILMILFTAAPLALVVNCAPGRMMRPTANPERDGGATPGRRLAGTRPASDGSPARHGQLETAISENAAGNLELWNALQKPPEEYAATVGQALAMREFPEPSGPTTDSPLSWQEIGSGIFRDDHRPAGYVHWSGRITSAQYAFDRDQSQYVLYLGASSGGLWKQDVVGVFPIWRPLSDNLPGSPSVGAFRVHRNDSRRIVIGTGDYTRYSGDGLYWTDDGGGTWNKSTTPGVPFYVMRIAQDEDNPEHVLAATNLGVLASYDFGQTWDGAVFDPDDNGFPDAWVWATEVIQDPADPHRWLAGAWGGGLRPDGVLESVDGGARFVLIGGTGGAGLAPPFQRMRLTISPVAPQYVFAIISGHNECTNPATAAFFKPPPDEKCTANSQCVALYGGLCWQDGQNQGVACTTAADCVEIPRGVCTLSQCSERIPSNRMNFIYRSADRGYTWEAIDVADTIAWGQAYHAIAIAVDPRNPDRLFVGMGAMQRTENATAPKVDDFPTVQWRRTDDKQCDADNDGTIDLPNTLSCDLDAAHADLTSLLFVPDVADPNDTGVLITSDGGYFHYDIITDNVQGEGNYWGLNIEQTMNAPGTFSGGHLAPQGTLLAGLQDNGVVRIDQSASADVLYLGGLDGGVVSFSPVDANDIAFSSGASWYRYISESPPWKDKDGAWSDVNCSHSKEGYPVPMQIDPAPGRAGTRYAYTTDGTYVWRQPVGPDCLWSKVHNLPLQMDKDGDGTVDSITDQNWFSMASHPTCRVFYVLTAWDPRMLVLDDCLPLPIKSQRGIDRTPPMSFTTTSNSSVHADRSTLQPDTVYYTTALSRPSRAFLSQDRGQNWHDATGDLAIRLPDADYLELVGNPSNLNQLFLATNLGVFRTDNGLDPYPYWYRYMSGLPWVADVQGIELAYDGAPQPTLRIGTYGRGFWERAVRSPWGGTVPDDVNRGPLQVRSAGPGVVELSWSPSCATGDGDFAVYEGPLTTTSKFRDHWPAMCSTGGATAVQIQAAYESAYFLIAPIASHDQATTEGSMGAETSGTERSGLQHCYTRVINGCP